MKTRSSFVILVFLGVVRSVVATGTYGIPVDGAPSYFERVALMSVNLARVDPETYQKNYLPMQTSIMRESNYPRVPPLAFDMSLGDCARGHSQQLAAHDCRTFCMPPSIPCDWNNKKCFTHSSKNGDSAAVRIQGCLPTVGTWSENIAARTAESMNVGHELVIQLINDSAAADLTSDAGHRTNIMSASSKILGNGYVYDSAALFSCFMTQDFGSTTPGTSCPIASGAHWFDGSDTVFYAALFDRSKNVSKFQVVIDDVSHVMDFSGSAGQEGFWNLTTARSGSERQYFFRVTMVDGSVGLYPEDGWFYTFGEGGSERDYGSGKVDPPSSGSSTLSECVLFISVFALLAMVAVF